MSKSTPAARSGFLVLALFCGFAALLSLSGCLISNWGSDDPVAARVCREINGTWHVTAEFAPAWSPAGDEIVASVSFNPRGALSPGWYLADLHGHGWKKLAQTSGWLTPRTALWNPHSRQVLISYDPGADILDIGTGELRSLVDANGQRIFRARWSPEGDSIWYGRTGGTHVMAAAGGPPRLFMATSSEFQPAGGWSFSPDGQTIAFAHSIREDNGVTRWRSEIRLIGRDGRNMRQITNLAGEARNPLWIHGGREILFDWADTLCVNQVLIPERYWLAVDVMSGRVRHLGQYLGTPEYQFSFPIGVDASGDLAAVVGGSIDEHGSRVGVLYVTSIERGKRWRVFPRGSPEVP